MGDHGAPDAPKKDYVPTGHVYDGIEEYDNPMPGWLHGIFFATILFAGLYFYYYHLGAGATLKEQHDAEVAANMRLQFSEIGELAPDEATILKYAKDSKWVAFGGSVFAGNCVSCHGQKAEGLVGPNLTDDHYINVKTVDDLYRVIKDGAKKGAMPAWANRLSKNELVLLASYLVAIRGTNVPGSLGPQGEVAPPFGAK